MIGFIRAHGYDPGPTQRPYLAGALAGLVATLPSGLLFVAFGSLEIAAHVVLRIPISLAALAFAGAFVVAGILYGAIFQRAANDVRAGWLFGLVFGFLLWIAAPIFVIPLLGARFMASGAPATGFLVTFLAWGLFTGLLFPHVHKPLHGTLTATKRFDPSAAFELKL
jgi:hypothetical protein